MPGAPCTCLARLHTGDSQGSYQGRATLTTVPPPFASPPCQRFIFHTNNGLYKSLRAVAPEPLAGFECVVCKELLVELKLRAARGGVLATKSLPRPAMMTVEKGASMLYVQDVSGVWAARGARGRGGDVARRALRSGWVA